MLEDPQKLGQGRTSHSVTERQPCSIPEWLTNFPNRNRFESPNYQRQTWQILFAGWSP
jgi:hypothetical protein